MTDFKDLQRFSSFQTHSQGVRAANRELTLLDGQTESAAREALERVQREAMPEHWSDDFKAGVRATFDDAMHILDAHKAKRERAEHDAQLARQRAEQARVSARQSAAAALQKAEKALADAEHAGARLDAYAEQREADASRPLPRLYDARFK